MSDPVADPALRAREILYALGAMDGEDWAAYREALTASRGDDRQRRIQWFRLAEGLSFSCEQSAPPLAVKRRLLEKFRVSAARPAETMAFSRPHPGALEKWAHHFGKSRHAFLKSLCLFLTGLLVLSWAGWAWTFQSWYANREAGRFEAHRIGLLTDSLSAQAANLALFSASSLRSTELTGTSGNEGARGRLVWESLHGQALLSLSGLPPAEGYYRVWVAGADKVTPVATLPASRKLPNLTPLSPLPEKARRRITSVTVTLEANPSGSEPTGSPIMTGIPLQ